MKTQFSKEKMRLEWILLLRQPLLEGPLLETNESIPLREKKKRRWRFLSEKYYRTLFKCPYLKRIKGNVIRQRLYTRGHCIK